MEVMTLEMKICYDLHNNINSWIPAEKTGSDKQECEIILLYNIVFYAGKWRNVTNCEVTNYYRIKFCGYDKLKVVTREVKTTRILHAGKWGLKNYFETHFCVYENLKVKDWDTINYYSILCFEIRNCRWSFDKRTIIIKSRYGVMRRAELLIF
jgi:hypothetical protein